MIGFLVVVYGGLDVVLGVRERSILTPFMENSRGSFSFFMEGRRLSG